MYSKYFNFRINQFFRAINKNVALGNCVVIALIVMLYLKLPQQNYYPFFFITPLIIFHFQRKDIPFLKNIKKSWKIILTIEYLSCLFIISVFSRNYQIEYTLLAPIFVCFILPNIRVMIAPRVIKLSLLPNHLFEIKTAIRKTPILFIFQIILIYASSFHPFTLFFILLFSMEFFSNIYNEIESKELLQFYFLKYDLYYKISSHLLFYNIILLPAYFIYCILDNDPLYLIIYVIFINLFINQRISLKYESYNHHLKFHPLYITQIIGIALSIVLIIPFLYYCTKSQANAINNINRYVRN